MGFTQEQWDTLIVRYPPGTPVSGTVISCPVFGVFVRLDELPDVSALLEVIHFSLIEIEPKRRIEYPTDYPPIGSRVDARILGWCLQPKDVRLTQLNDLNWTHDRKLADYISQAFGTLPTKEEAFEIAIIDGVNIFVRTVLKAQGLMTQEQFDKTGTDEILKLKYQVARKLAGDWAKMPLRDQ